MSASHTSNKTYLSTLISRLKPYRTRLILGLSAAALAAAFEILSPMLLRSGVNALQENKPVGWLYSFSGLIIMAAIIGGFFRYEMRSIVIGVSRFIESDIREGFFSHLLSLAPSFFDRNLTGDLMARSTDDIDRVRMVMGPALLYSVSTLLTLIFSAIMMFILDARLAFLVLLLAPVIATVVLAVAGRLHRLNLHQQEVYGKLQAHVQENLTGIRVVKSFVREAYESRKFVEVCLHYFKCSMDVVKVQAMFMPVLTLLIGLGIVMILFVGGQRTASGTITLGDFIAFMSYLSLMTWPMIAIGWVTHLYQRGGASHRRLEDIFSVNEQFDSSSHAAASNPFSQSRNVSDTGQVLPVEREPHITAPTIIYRNIGFRYNYDTPDVFRGLNLTIPSGSTLAIVGRTGSGKSTLLRLLARLYEPQDGEILFSPRPPLTPPPETGGGNPINTPPPLCGGGIKGGGAISNKHLSPHLTNIKGGRATNNNHCSPISADGNEGSIRWDSLPVEHLRRMIGYVDQTPFLFSATIHDNISFGKPNATDEEIEIAARLACFDSDIEEFPDGYQTRIGERGVTLSGGQQQRLTIARALIAESPILALDDALSAVDTSTEAEIIGNLSSQDFGRTVLIITHRLAAAERADKIAVLENGKVIEFGAHLELIDIKGKYAAMYHRQRISDELGAMT